MGRPGEEQSSDVLSAFATRAFHSAVGNVVVNVNGSLCLTDVHTKCFDDRFAVQAMVAINSALTSARAALADDLARATGLVLPPPANCAEQDSVQYAAERSGVIARVSSATWLVTDLSVATSEDVRFVVDVVNAALAAAEASRELPDLVASARWACVVDDLRDVEALLNSIAREY